MSRALDQETITSLKNSYPNTVYEDIVKALSTKTKNGSLLEIEFLGKSHPLPPGCNVLVDGNNIAVTKGKLVQAFVVARKLFFECLKDHLEDSSQELKDATAVMLLMDPENLTAANARKRLIQSYQKNRKTNLEEELRNELRFVDSYLTSRLHRHTKSPTLWSHRRWVLQFLKSSGLDYSNIQQDINAIVFVSAERHPRNYYAWSHLRWLVHTFSGDFLKTQHTNLDLSKLVSDVKDWCLRHPADTSGFSFLLFCLSLPESSRDISRKQRKSSICTEVIRLAVSYKWTHETVWVFLRTLVASGGLPKDNRTTFFQAIQVIRKVQPDGHRILDAAQDWCLKYSPRGDT